MFAERDLFCHKFLLINGMPFYTWLAIYYKRLSIMLPSNQILFNNYKFNWIFAIRNFQIMDPGWPPTVHHSWTVKNQWPQMISRLPFKARSRNHKSNTWKPQLMWSTSFFLWQKLRSEYLRGIKIWDLANIRWQLSSAVFIAVIRGIEFSGQQILAIVLSRDTP
jgi:hypothetical protein